MKNLNYSNILTTFILTLFSATVVLGQEAYTGKKDNVDLSEYQTYEWVFSKENIPENQMILDGSLMLIYNNTSSSKVIKDAINTQLEAEGFKHDYNNPDMLVNFQVLEKPTELRTFTMDTGWAFVGFGPKSTDAKMVPVEAGTVIVNFIDADTGSLVWQGFASGAFDVSDMKDVSKLEAKVIAIFDEWNFDPFAD